MLFEGNRKQVNPNLQAVGSLPADHQCYLTENEQQESPLSEVVCNRVGPRLLSTCDSRANTMRMLPLLFVLLPGPHIRETGKELKRKWGTEENGGLVSPTLYVGETGGEKLATLDRCQISMFLYYILICRAPH